MVLSPQAISELVVSLLRLDVPRKAALEVAENSIAYVTHPIDQAVIRRAMHIFTRHQTSWWDALMIGWAAQAGCELLLTEDTQSAPVIEGVKIFSPFDFAPDAMV